MKNRWIVFLVIICVTALSLVFFVRETPQKDQSKGYFGPWKIHEPFITYFLSYRTLNYMGVNPDDLYYLSVAPLPEDQFKKLKDIIGKYNFLTVGEATKHIPNSSNLLELAIEQYGVTYNLTIYCDPSDYSKPGYFMIMKIELEKDGIYREPKMEQGICWDPNEPRRFISKELYQDLMEFLISIPSNSPLIREANKGHMNAIKEKWANNPYRSNQ